MAKKTTRGSSAKAKAGVPALRGASYTRWSITGVSQKTRTAVRKAAHKEGLSVGAWVDKTLHAVATETIKGGSPLLTLPPDLLMTIADMSRKLDSIEQRLNKKDHASPFNDLDHIADDFRKRSSQLFNQLQSTTSKATDSLVEHAESTMANIREIGSTTTERIKAATEAALEAVREKTETKADKTSKHSPKKP